MRKKNNCWIPSLISLILLVMSTNLWAEQFFYDDEITLENFSYKTCTAHGLYPLMAVNRIETRKLFVEFTKKKKLFLVMKNSNAMTYNNSYGSYAEQAVFSRDGVGDRGLNLFFTINPDRKQKLYDNGKAMVKIDKGLVLPITDLIPRTIDYWGVTTEWNIVFKVEHPIVNQVRLTFPYFETKNDLDDIEALLISYLKGFDDYFYPVRKPHTKNDIFELCASEIQEPRPTDELRLP